MRFCYSACEDVQVSVVYTKNYLFAFFKNKEREWTIVVMCKKSKMIKKIRKFNILLK